VIKWFCDVCGREIKAPEHPVSVSADRCGKNREDAEIGYGESDGIAKAFAHRKCADVLEAKIKEAFENAKRAVTGEEPT